MFLQADLIRKGALNLKEEKILGYIRQISAAVDAHCRTTSEQSELTPMQCFCIMYIHENKGSDFCSTDLCDILGTSRASVSLLLKGLKQKGYLQMISVEGDDRKKQLELTPKAAEFTVFLKEDMNSLDNALIEGIPAEDIPVISRGLKIMLANIKKYPKGGMCCDKNTYGTDQTV